MTIESIAGNKRSARAADATCLHCGRHYSYHDIVKYISRWRDKGGVEDLRKIKQYVDFLIEQETK
jgi:hypothetical protein